MAIYLIDKPFSQVAVELAKMDREAKIVLLRDGVYADTKGIPGTIKVWAIGEDVEKRGLQSRKEERVELIDYSRLVDLIVANKVVNFV